jgi:hypothetical protein
MTLSVCRLYMYDGMINERGAAGGMRIGGGTLSTRRKPGPVPLCVPQIPRNLTWDRTWATTVGSRVLTAWATVRPAVSVAGGGGSGTGTIVTMKESHPSLCRKRIFPGLCLLPESAGPLRCGGTIYEIWKPVRVHGLLELISVTKPNLSVSR